MFVFDLNSLVYTYMQVKMADTWGVRMLLLVLMATLRFADAQSCDVNSFDVHADFDINLLLGKWYVVRTHPSSTPAVTDHTHNYVATASGNVTVYEQYRSTDGAMECGGAVNTLSTTNTPGKLQYTDTQRSTPYWVLDTDYTGYALVYGCVSVSSTGVCDDSQAWVLSRSKNISQQVEDRVTLFLTASCLQSSGFQNISQNNGGIPTITKSAVECAVRTHWKYRDSQTCLVNNIQQQDNFDLNKYAGTWYETRWLAPFNYPADQLYQDYQHHYVITGDGNVTGYIYGRDPANPDQCFYNSMTIVRTDTPETFVFLVKDDPPVPYTVLKTDYTQYAVVYGCYNVSADGTCYMARSWVWSRTPTLNQSLQYEINTLLQDICVNPSAFLDTQQNQPCPFKVHFKLRDNQDCAVDNINVQDNFDINKYAGTWYETRWLASFSIPANQLFQDYQHHYVITGDGNITGYIYGRSPDNPEQCFYYSVELQRSDTPGKFTYIYKDDPPVPYTVLKTDYTQYAVVYGCYNVSADGTCYMARSWVWSRTPTLNQSLQYEINTLLQDICVNPSAFLDTQQNQLCQQVATWKLDRVSDCKVTAFNVIPNFDLLKFTGFWYQSYWLSLAYPTTVHTDRLLELHPSSNGDITYYQRLRNGGVCSYSTGVNKKTSTLGEFTSSEFKDPFTQWVVSTDYTSYAVMYGCREVSGDGVCLVPWVVIWSRTPTLPNQILYRANTILQDHCINPSALIRTQNTQTCPPQPIKDCSDVQPSSGRKALQMTLVTLILPFFNIRFCN